MAQGHTINIYEGKNQPFQGLKLVFFKVGNLKLCGFKVKGREPNLRNMIHLMTKVIHLTVMAEN